MLNFIVFSVKIHQNYHIKKKIPRGCANILKLQDLPLPHRKTCWPDPNDTTLATSCVTSYHMPIRIIHLFRYYVNALHYYKFTFHV